MKKIEMVYEQITTEETRIKDIVKKCPDVNPNTVWSSIVSLLKKGKIMRPTKGKYKRL